MTQDKPFTRDDRLSSHSIQLLRNWLVEHGNPKVILGGAYTVEGLINDLDLVLDGMWNDGIDAMGVDA